MAKKARAGERNGSEAKARRVLAACEASGLSMRAYAVREGLRPRRLYWWTNRLELNERSAREEARAVHFVPAVVKVNAARVTSDPAITIRVGATTTMEISDPTAVPTGWLAEVMAELERIACS